jgi:putative SOS response-associated peptidase YedK
VIFADVFFEHVPDANGRDRILEFVPRTGEQMIVACLWSRWKDPAGKAPDLLSFAAITDEPEPEVAAAGHDRTIVNIKPEHLDAWLNPDSSNLAALYAIFDDKRHPYYEHRIEAAA